MVTIVLLLFYLIRGTTTQSSTFDPCESPRIDAMIWTHQPNKVLLFVDQYYWKYDTAAKEISAKTIIRQHWSHITGPLSGATTVLRGKGITSTYFIKDNTYTRYDNRGNVFETTFTENGKVKTEFEGDIGAVSIIKGILGDEETNAIVCDKSGKNIYFCVVNYADRTLTFNKCTSQPSNKLPEGSCKALSKNSESTYLIAGRITMIQSSTDTVSADLVVCVFIIIVYTAIKYRRKQSKHSQKKPEVKQPRKMKRKQ
ncbi:hypothetical protein B4U80_13871 [Leptotrombidium deliense]|uniref:Uncharacterized protein n=1 Tax=Leptotrombidium deliense TaxID=299467 RepID=A0A443SA43_9ACAR|nr:hypothetical protein B4U80_13871 [Leptotrombidium deliense]